MASTLESNPGMRIIPRKNPHRQSRGSYIITPAKSPSPTAHRLRSRISGVKRINDENGGVTATDHGLDSSELVTKSNFGTFGRANQCRRSHRHRTSYTISKLPDGLKCVIRRAENDNIEIENLSDQHPNEVEVELEVKMSESESKRLCVKSQPCPATGGVKDGKIKKKPKEIYAGIKKNYCFKEEMKYISIFASKDDPHPIPAWQMNHGSTADQAQECREETSRKDDSTFIVVSLDDKKQSKKNTDSCYICLICDTLYSELVDVRDCVRDHLLVVKDSSQNEKK